MKHKRTRLAHIYRDNQFIGYAVAVDGQILSNQLVSEIESDPAKPAVIKVSFAIDLEMNDNPVRIDAR